MNLFMQMKSGQENEGATGGLSGLITVLREAAKSSREGVSLESFSKGAMQQSTIRDDDVGVLRSIAQNLGDSMRQLGSVSFGPDQLSMESFGADGRADTKRTLKTKFEDNMVGFYAAAMAGAMTVSNESLRAYVDGVDRAIPARQAYPGEELAVVQGQHRPDVITKTAFLGLNLESYDETAIRTTSVFSQIYALNKGGQEPAIEMLFPTVLVAPSELGYGVSIPLIQVHNNVKHKLDNKQTDFGFQHIVHAYVHEEILRDDTTRIVPVWRTQYQDWFVPVADITVENRDIDGEPVPTSFLAIGEEVNLVKVCQNAAFLETGTADIGDTIDPGMHLDEVLLKVGAEVIKIKVRNLDGSNFWAPPQGLNREEKLAFDSRVVQLRGKVQKADGSPSTELADIETLKLALRLRMNITGTVHLDTGELLVNANGVRVNSILKDGEPLSVEDPSVATLVAKLKAATVIGYSLHGFLSNANRRQLGQLINTRYYTQLYPVKKRSPISAIRSQVVDGSTSEATDIANLLTASSIRMTNSGIDTIFQADAMLHAHVNNDEKITDAARVLGIAHHIVGSFYERDVIDIEEELMTRNSVDKTRDMQAVLVNRIRDAVVRAHTQIAYSAAASVILGNEQFKPLVMVLTDPIIGNYLMLHGDLRTLGENFTLKVGTSLNIRLRGKIFVTFGIEEALSSGQPNPLHFGSAGFKPEAVIQLPTVFNGGQHNQITVHPNYEHNVNLPVLIRFDVVNIPESIIKRTPMLMYTRSLDAEGGEGEENNGG